MSSTVNEADAVDESTAVPVKPTAELATEESKEIESVVPTEQAQPADDNAIVTENAPSTTNSCACNKSRCLKLYCDCLSNGNRCSDKCQCKDCHNNEQYEDEAFQAIRAALDRNPDAFSDEIKQKVGWVPAVKAPTTGKKRGRPKGSLNKIKPLVIPGPAVKKSRGRPRKDDNYSPLPESLTPPPDPIAFTAEDYPQLAMDSNENYSHLATSFTRPLFPPSDAPTSKPLQIAYSHRSMADHSRKLAQIKKNALLDEYKKIREKYLEKKLELSLANDDVEKCDKEAGAWTKKVFDLELEEPCDWNDKLNKLKKYVEKHHKLPPKNLSRCEDEDAKEVSKWLESLRGKKVQQDKEVDNDETNSSDKQSRIDLADYPHRIEALKAFNVHFKERSQNKFETMFQKLLDYKEEHGTVRFPSDEQCAASGDEEIIALQKWVKSQVLNFRYAKKKTDPAIVKRFVDIGFSFDRWYAKPGKKKGDTNFDEIAQRAAEEADENNVDDDGQDQKMPADDNEDRNDEEVEDDGDEVDLGNGDDEYLNSGYDEGADPMEDA